MSVRHESSCRGGFARGVLFILVLGPVVAFSVGDAADAVKPPAVPADTAVLDVLLPPGARLLIDGRPSDETRITCRPIAKGQTRTEEVRVRFRDGQEVMRSVLLRGGWHVRLPLKEPGSTPVRMLLQSGHTSGVVAVSFSPDGKHVLTGSHDKTAILWDAQTGQKLRTFGEHTESVLSVAFSADGKHVLTGSADKTAILWDAQTGQKLRTFQGHTDLVWSVSFSPDGKHVLTSGTKTAVLWEAQTGQKLRTFQGHSFSVNSVSFSPDGKHVLTGSWDKTAILWEAQTGQKLHTFQGHTDSVNSVAFSPDGKHVLTGSKDKTAILWDAQTGQKLRTFQGHTSMVYSVAFSPDGRYVLTGSEDKTAILWDAQTDHKLRTFRGHTGEVRSVSFSPDGKHVLTGSEDKTAILWEAVSGQQVRTFKGHTGQIWSVSFGPDGKQFLTGSWDTSANLWDAQIGQQVRTFQGHRHWLQSVAFSPDGKHVLTGSNDRTAVLWDAQTGQRLRTFQGHTNAIVSVSLGPDSKHVLTGSWDNTAILWDARTGQKVHTFQGHTREVKSVAFSPNGEHVLTGSEDKTAILRGAQTGEKLRTFQGHTREVSSVSLGPDGKHILTGSWDKTAILWGAQTGEKLRTFEGHANLVTAVSFSPDAKYLLTGSLDKTAILWDARTGQKLHTFRGHTNSIHAVSFSPDGKHVLTGSGDGTTRLWDVATGDELARLISLDAGKDWLVVSPEGLFDGSAGGREKVSYRIGSGLNVVPVDRFFQDFYRPGLLAALMKGERSLPEVEIGTSAPPALRIVSPMAGGPVEAAQVTLEVEATDQGGGVRGPTLFHNGTRLLIDTPTQTRAKVVRRTFAVTLVAGDNLLEVRAATRDGSQDSEPARITLRYAKALGKPDLYALAVGVNRYAQDSLNLEFAAADARALADLFGRRGKSLYGAVHATTLVDDKATRAAIRAALEGIAAKAKPQDTLVVFLAGHGTMVGQRYFFVPHEFKRTQGKELEQDVRQQGLAADVLGDYLAAVPALKRLLILDTCASGGAVGLTKTARNPFAFRGAIERLSRAQGVFTLAAAASGEEAQEVKELGHGVLSYALLAGLRAAEGGPLEGQSVRPDSPDQVASVLEWFNFASGQVPRLTKKYFGREQDVQMSGQGNSFPILPVEERQRRRQLEVARPRVHPR